MRPARYCAAPGCERPARGTFCELHWKRHREGRSLSVPAAPRGLTPAERHFEACLALVDAEDPEEYHRARVRWLQSACALAASLGRERPVETGSTAGGTLAPSPERQRSSDDAGQPASDRSAAGVQTPTAGGKRSEA